MESLREKTQTQISEAEKAQRHNAMISERYNWLKNAVDSQFAEETKTEERVAENAYASDFAPEKPALYISPNKNTAAYAQTPTVTEYVSPARSALFTTEKFEMLGSVEETVEPVVEPVQSATVQMESQYSLSPLAKIVMAVFTFVIVAMLTLICVNTNILSQKRIKIQNLEEKQEQLMDQYEEIQRRIENATSEETIREYAESQGMIKAGN